MRIRYEIALCVLAVGALYMAIRIMRLILLSVGMEHNFCPRCGGKNVKPSKRRFSDLPYRICFLRPYRCIGCEKRFFAVRSRSERAARTATSSAAETAPTPGENNQSVATPSRNGA